MELLQYLGNSRDSRKVMLKALEMLELAQPGKTDSPSMQSFKVEKRLLMAQEREAKLRGQVRRANSHQNVVSKAPSSVQGTRHRKRKDKASTS